MRLGSKLIFFVCASSKDLKEIVDSFEPGETVASYGTVWTFEPNGTV